MSDRNIQKIYERAAECRIFLHIHGFLAESENDKVWSRIDKYGTQWDVNKIKKPLSVKKEAQGKGPK